MNWKPAPDEQATIRSLMERNRATVLRVHLVGDVMAFTLTNSDGTILKTWRTSVIR